MKYTVSKAARCPFYRGETRQVIYCQGIKPGQGFHLACRSPKEALEHKKKHCRDQFRLCPLEKLLEAAYE